MSLPMLEEEVLPEGKDIYELEKELLLAISSDFKFKRVILHAWPLGDSHAHLFDICGPQRVPNSFKLNEGDCGCLTQVKGGLRKAATTELTLAILADDRIPDWNQDITREALDVFCEYQRKMDIMFNRVVPTTTGVRSAIRLAEFSRIM